MQAHSPPHVIQLTPPGRGAIATLRIEGAAAVDLVGSFLVTGGKPLASFPVDRLVVGRFVGKRGAKVGEDDISEAASTTVSTPGEQVVVRVCADGAVEIHCHGGQAAVSRIEHELTTAGCKIVPWQSWATDAHDDPFAVAALEGLIEARTERTAAILLNQYQGAFRRALQDIQDAVEQGDLESATRQCSILLDRADLGRHLTQPWRVVLGGAVNVGKSSLVNTLVGYGRSIVHSTAGTTRDAVTVSTAVDGWPIDLCDTAGLHVGLDVGHDPVEFAGIARARQRLAAADLVVLVFDHHVPWSDNQQALLDEWPAALVVFNKCDLPRAAGNRPAGLTTSATHGDGVAELLAALSTRLVHHPPTPGMAIPLNDQQVVAIRKVADAIRSG